jgi:type II secretory pathway component PulM
MMALRGLWGRLDLSGRWQRFSPRERHQFCGALCFVIVVFYGALLWMPGNKQLGELVYSKQKQDKRFSASRASANELKKFDFNAMDTEGTRRELARAMETLRAQSFERERLLTRFVPLDDLETLQVLKSEITALAEKGDMEVLALEHIYRRADDRDLPPTQALIREAAENNRYKRPLLSLKARASYRGLMEFLDGLPTLSRVAAPVWSDIVVKREEQKSGQTGALAVPRQWLEVEIRLAI